MSTIFVDNIKTVSGTDTLKDGQFGGTVNSSATLSSGLTFAGTTTGTHSGASTGTHSGTTTGTISSSATFPSGTVITHTQYSSTTGQDYSGTSEAVYTSIGNPMVFVKKKDASTSKLFFTTNVKMFDSVGYHLSLGFRVRKGTDTSGTEIARGDAYDLFHSLQTSPYRTGMNLHLNCDEITDEGAGNFNFVLNAYRNGYSEPVAVTNAVIHMYEIMI